MDIKDYNKVYDCLNVGQLKKLLENVPDETIILTPKENADAAQMYSLDTMWFDALTINFES